MTIDIDRAQTIEILMVVIQARLKAGPKDSADWKAILVHIKEMKGHVEKYIRRHEAAEGG